MGSGLGLLILHPQPGSSPRMRLGMGRAARGRVSRPPGCPRPSSASVEEAPGRAMVGTAASQMPRSGDGSQSISVFRKVMLTEWAGAAGLATSMFSPSPAAPAGWGQLQLDRPLGSQSGTLGPRHNLGQARWHPRCSLQLSPSSTISPSSPATSPFLRSHLLPSSCSGVAWLLASTHSLPAPAAHRQHQGHPTHWGRAITGSDQGNNPQKQAPPAAPAWEQQLSHGGTPGWPLPWQQG